MILVDTSVWINHFRRGMPRLFDVLQQHAVLIHPMVRGELACGNLKDRNMTLKMLLELPQAIVADDQEVLRMIEQHRLMGLGLGWVDVHLLASALLDEAPLWSVDQALADAARSLGCFSNA